MLYSGKHVWVLLALCAVLAPALTGCSTQSRSTGSHADERDREFDLAADRPPTPRTLQAMGRILVKQEKYDQAEYVLRRAIRDYPNYMPSYNDLADMQVRLGRVNEAVETLYDALALAPQDAVLLNNLGMCRMLQGEYNKALTQFTLASERQPEDAHYRANMAFAMGMLGRYDESLALYTQIIPRWEAHHNVALICESRKDAERANQEHQLAKHWEESLKKPASEKK